MADFACLDPVYVDDAAGAVNLGTNVQLMFCRWAREENECGYHKSRDGFCTTLGGVGVGAQSQRQGLGAGGTINNSPPTDTGIICQEEATVTFRTTATYPNASGCGSSGARAASSGGTLVHP
jgi:hypothetical protein